VLEFWQQRSGGSHGRCYHGAFEPVVELGSFGQTLRRLVKRSRPVSAIPFGRLVLQVRGPDRIGAFHPTSMKTKKLIQSSRGPKASHHNKSKRQCGKSSIPMLPGSTMVQPSIMWPYLRTRCLATIYRIFYSFSASVGQDSFFPSRRMIVMTSRTIVCDAS